MRGALAAIALLALSGAASAETCADNRLDIRGDFGAARFTVEIADDFAERAEGLMNRASLPASQGMLFVYEQPGQPSFWMKNTLIPLDMVFIDAEGVVRHVHPMAVPGDLTPISGGDGVLAVLEVRGGVAASIGIAPGAEVRHPAFDPAHAAWPCTP